MGIRERSSTRTGDTGGGSRGEVCRHAQKAHTHHRVETRKHLRTPNINTPLSMSSPTDRGEASSRHAL